MADVRLAVTDFDAMMSRLHAAEQEVEDGEAVEFLRWLAEENLPALFGAPHVPQSEFFRTNAAAAPWIAWWIFAAALAAVAARAVWLQMRAGAGAAPPAAIYLILVGAQAAIVYAVAGVEIRTHVLVRYTLLALLVPVGVIAWHLAIETRRAWTRATLALLVLWTMMAAAEHVTLIREYSMHRPPNPYRQLVEYLRGRGVQYAETDYWTAYTITFLSNEALKATPRDTVRIEEYQRAVDAHDAEAVRIWLESGFCERETRLGQWFLCGL
jgi:hypothetical protein